MKHGMVWASMVTVLTVGFSDVAPAVALTDHEVRQVGFEFVPRDIKIEVGDTVRWIWTGGDHTVTESDTCFPGEELLFDAPLDADNPEFTFRFDSVGVVDYICRPHCETDDMVGTVTVVVGAIPCEDYKKAKFKCRNGTVKIKIILKDKSHAGETMTVKVTGETEASKELTVKRKKAKGKIKNVKGKVIVGIDGCDEHSKSLNCR